MQRNPLLLTVLPAVLALGLIGGCSASPDDQDSPTTEQTSQAPTAQPDVSPTSGADPAPEDSPSEGTVDPATETDGNFDTAIAAARLAMDQLDNSTVFGLDAEDQNSVWEIDLIGPDGKEYDITVSGDGTEVVKPLAEDSTSDDKRAKNTAMIERMEVNFDQALQIAGDQFENAVLDEIDLDLDNDVLRWEVELTDDQGTEKEFDIDATTGEISNQR